MPGNENDGGMAGLFTGPVDDDATWAAADLPCVHDLVGFHAARAPERTALTWEGGSLTYRALVEEAAGVAGRLGAVALGAPIGILLGGGPQVVVAMLAIMRTGGAYMPLSLDDPPARRERLLRDAGCEAVITTRDLAVRLPSGVRAVALDEPAGPAAEAGPAAVRADDLAYVLFTSGSTGRPKGVQVTHRSIVNLVLRDRELFEADGVHCMLAPLSFDGSTIEIWGALCAGGRLVVPDGRVVDPSEIDRLVRRFGVTLIFLTRGLFNQVVEAGMSGLGGLRHLTTGGDVMSPAHTRLALERLPHTELVNVYGPTETTAFVTTCRLTRPQDVEDVIPIGHAVPGARLYVLDEELRESETGELYVGGLPLARGYIGEAPSAGSFTPDPFAASPEARMYRTGDRVRRRADGALVFLGRVDDQVKVRGHRVEPSEVESTALGRDGVRQACCVARGDVTGELSLALYVVADADTEAIRAHLRDRLPPYAEPAWIVPLDELPLTPLGKVDRAALPEPVRPVAAPAEVPATAAEQKIIEVWSRLLGVPGLGPDDDFFASGGHSLLAIRSATELRELIGAGVPYAVFMEHPTPRRLAAWIQGGRPASLDAPGGAIPRWDRREPAPLSSPQEQIWILQHLYPESQAYHFQALLRFTGALSVPALETALGRVIERHEVFRTSFGDVDGVPVQSAHPHEPFRLPVTDLAGLGDAERESGLADLTRRLLDAPFDLERPPLARWRLARLGESEHMLIHVEHHLIHDGWSFNQFLGELTEDYRQAVDGRVPPPAEGELDYIDFAAWHREWLDNGERRRQLDHWLSRLDGCPPTSELPADRERPAVPSFAGASMRIPLPQDLSTGLRAFSRRHGVSLFTVLMSGFFVFVHRRTGQEDLCVGSALANRTRPETQRLIGMLVNSLPIRVRVDPSRGFADVLDGTRRALAQAQDHQDLPVHEIVAATGAPRDVSRNPFFQLAFSSHDAPLASLRLPGAELSVTEGISNGSAKFDLGVIVIPRLEQGLGAAPGEHGESITLLWEYATDLFDAATVESIAAEYLALLRRLVPIPDTPLCDLPGDEGPGSIEDLVTGIWAELLKQPRVGPEDDFFDLGGHSLLAIRTASRLEKHLGFKVPAVEVLRHPTARTLAEHLSVRAGERSPALSVKGRS